MPQASLFKGRDKRNKGWFWMDNDYLNGYARIFGAVGTAVYVSLCRHANMETQKCFPAMDLMAEELSVSRNTISKYLKLFEKHHLISVEKERDTKTKKWLNNVYTLLDKSEWDSHAQIVGMVGSHAQLVSEPCTTDSESHAQPLRNKETNIKETNTKSAETSSADIISVIDCFKVVNLSFKGWYKNTTQRKACQDLINTYTLERVLTVVSKTLPKTNGIQFFPTITTPVQLRDKWAALESSVRKYQAEKVEKQEKYKVAFH